VDHDPNSTPGDTNVELIGRLGALVPEAVDPATRAAHLRRARAVEPVPRRRRIGVVAVAAAAVVGFLAGSAGFAAAGSLPDPAQDVAHDVFGVIEVDVPQGNGNRGSCVSAAAKIKDKDAKQAAKDACPKGGIDDDTDETDSEETDTDSPGRSGDAPGQSGDSPGRSGDAPGQAGDSPGRSSDAPGQTKHAGDPCRGKPAWAGPMSKAEREALKEQHGREACVDAEDPDETGDG
jgi:hypothetical protein